MPTLESDKIRTALTVKLGCIEKPDKDHSWFLLYDEKKLVSRTCMSHGSKHTITEDLISKMSKQIKLGTISNFVGMVSCTKSKEDCLKVIKSQA